MRREITIDVTVASNAYRGWLFVLLLLSGCSVDRFSVLTGDGGYSFDSGRHDAGRDAGDAHVDLDAGFDAYVPDASDDDAGALDGGDGAVTDAGDGGGLLSCMSDPDCEHRTCHEANCSRGLCMYTPLPFGPATDEPQDDHDCQTLYCDGNGATIAIADALDPPADDGNYCTIEACSNTMPVHVPMQNNVLLPSDQQIAGDCKVKRCENGEAVDANDDSDRPVATACEVGACNAGVPSMTPRDRGLVCGVDQVCDQNGNCIACRAQAATCTDDWQCCGGDCVGGICGAACPSNHADCDGMDNNGCETPTNTLTNCGACGTTCALANATESCSTGTCTLGTCTNGFDDCNNVTSDGCEQSLRTLNHCGGCGVVCERAHATATCVTATCSLGACHAGWGNCDGNNANGCESPTNTLAHCGACNTPCAFANATATCSTGTCTRLACNTGFQDCDGNSANGCEAALNTLTHCGACNTACTAPANRAASCSTGTCVVGACNAGFQDCDGNNDNGCEWSTSGGPCPCRGTDDSDNDGLSNCSEIDDGDPFTDPAIFNGARVVHLPLCSSGALGLNCNNYDTLGEVLSCTNRTARETLNQYAGWDWQDPSGLQNPINSADFGFLPNWSGTNTSFQIDAQAVVNLTQSGRHCFRINGGNGTGPLTDSCGSLYIANTPASTFCGWSSLASDTEAVVQHDDAAVCLQLSAGVYPIRWHLDRQASAQGDFHLDYCFGGTTNCAPTDALPSRMLRPSAPSTCQVPASDCTQAIYDGHDYWFCDNPMTWSQARAACQSIGMDLAMITSAAENAFITDIIETDHWIGLADEIPAGGVGATIEGTWMWIPTYTPIWIWSNNSNHGTPIGTNYVHWAKDNPNQDTSRNCGEIIIGTGLMADGFWNDTTCGTAQSFICEER